MSRQSLSAVIVDDEPLAIEGLRLRLEKIPEIKVIGEACDGEEAIEVCHRLNPDVLFLDLNLPGLTGLEVVQALQADVMPMIVFVTAYGEYALDAFELNAIDYIMKPANLGRLQKTVEKLLSRQAPEQSGTEKYRLLNALNAASGIAVPELEDWLKSDEPLPIAQNQKLVIKNIDLENIFLPVSDIRWIDAAGDYMCIHTPKETHVVRITMKKLEHQLDSQVFVRIHKSTLVNINFIRSIKPLRNSECALQLDDVQLKVSRNYSANIKALVEARKL